MKLSASIYRSSLIWLLILIPISIGPNLIELNDTVDSPIELNQTTAGVVAGNATPDGRPLIWKNRDRGGEEPMEFRYWNQGPIPFVGYTSNNERLECYAGINALGFGIANTDGHNFEPHGPHNDGVTMWTALSKCRTVDDFEAFLDSADRVDASGRYGYTYQVIDAYGGAAIIEAARFGHTRYNANDAPDGFLVRSNYAYSGPMNSLNDATHGLHRHNRAFIKFRRAIEEGRLTPRFIMQEVARDISSIDIDPYPLPFRGYYENNPYGQVPFWAAICRYTTSATVVIQGVRPGQNPDDAISWAMIGPPLGGITTPLWVRAGSVPTEYDGPTGSRLNNRIIALRNWACNRNTYIDTWKLIDPNGKGLWDYIIPLEEWIFNKTEQFLNSPNFNYDRLRAFQNEMAQQITDSLYNWKPYFNITEFAEPILLGSRVLLRWYSIQEQIHLDMPQPRGYNVYRSLEPFREINNYHLLGFTIDTSFIDSNPPLKSAFYKVEPLF